MTELNTNDFKKILEYYKKPIPTSNKKLKMQAESLLSTKLCKCIKKIDPINEARSIGICTKTIFNRKGLTRGKFSCKGKQNITIKKLAISNRKTKKNRK
jgi:hypothetical protein